MYQVADAPLSEEWRSPSSSCGRPPCATHRGKGEIERREERGRKRTGESWAAEQEGRRTPERDEGGPGPGQAGEMYLRRRASVRNKLGTERNGQRDSGRPNAYQSRIFPINRPLACVTTLRSCVLCRPITRSFFFFRFSGSSSFRNFLEVFG
jgi:hypothetical protein